MMFLWSRAAADDLAQSFLLKSCLSQHYLVLGSFGTIKAKG